MTKQEIIKYKLQPALYECQQHRMRLWSAWEEAITYKELQVGCNEELSEEQIRTIDQLLFRFGKLQDAIGTRLLPATLQLVQEWRDNEPFLDKLNRAEKLGMLPPAEQWQILRELRNQTAHEYPDQQDLVRANLITLLENVPALEKAHRQLTEWATKHT